MRDLAGGPVNRREYALLRPPGTGLLLCRVTGGRPARVVRDDTTGWSRMHGFRDRPARHGSAGAMARSVRSVGRLFAGGLASVVGACSHPAALVVASGFIVASALIGAHAPHAAGFPALASVAGVSCLVLAGARHLSINARLRGRL